jgi:hypothetical protein
MDHSQDKHHPTQALSIKSKHVSDIWTNIHFTKIII